jgi:hypothetical protein
MEDLCYNAKYHLEQILKCHIHSLSTRPRYGVNLWNMLTKNLVLLSFCFVKLSNI